MLEKYDMLELIRKIICFLIKLSTAVSLIFLFLVMLAASFNSVIFLKILILLFTAGLIKKIRDKSQKVLFLILLGSLFFLPYTEIIFTGLVILLVIDFTHVIYSKYENNYKNIIIKTFTLIGIVLLSTVLAGYIYPFYESNSIILVFFIALMLLFSFTLMVVNINFLMEIFQSDSRAKTD